MSLTEFPVVQNGNQTLWLLVAAAVGAAFCVFYELMKAFRAEIRHSSAAVFVEDVVFFAVCGTVYFCFCLVSDNGYVRIYNLVFAFLGSVFTKILLEKMLQCIFRPVFRLFKKIFLILNNIFNSLFQKIKIAGQKIIMFPKTKNKIKKKRKKALKSANQM